jgi:ubiquinone/menaquinone biosynthesis C-methylase UbiE
VKQHETNLQKRYYATTASDYDNQHLLNADEHFLALNYLEGLINFHGFTSILDVGAGTGRAALFLKKINSELRIVSIEPVEELREIGHAKGLKPMELLDGDAYNLDFKNSSFDLVCAFGVFHHLQNPVAVLEEMKRVSKHAIFISDTNNFGQGNLLSRTIKQVLNSLKVWKFAVFVKNKGKMYSISEGDGLAYSFSLFNVLKHLKYNYSIFMLSTVPSGRNIYRTASHLAIFALKKLKESEGEEKAKN